MYLNVIDASIALSGLSSGTSLSRHQFSTYYRAREEKISSSEDENHFSNYLLRLTNTDINQYQKGRLPTTKDFYKSISGISSSSPQFYS